MLSKDIAAEFRGRSSQIQVFPFSFAEYNSAVGGDKRDNIMTIKQILLFILSILIYVFALSLYGLEPLILLYDWDIGIFNIGTYCIFFTMVSFYLMTKSFQIKRIKFLYVLLFFMIYFNLVVGNKNVFDFIMKNLFKYYENHGMTNTDQYEKLFNIWANDVSRTFMFFFGLFYSFFSVLIYITVGKVKRRFFNRSVCEGV